MVWLPPARLAVVKLEVVTPAVVVNVPWPSEVAPSVKVTMPDGFANAVLPGLLTVSVAVNVTAWPDCAGLGEERSVMLVLALFTTCVKVDDVLVLKFGSPR